MQTTLPIEIRLVCEAGVCHAFAVARTPYGVFCARAEVSEAQAVKLYELWRAGHTVPEPVAAAAAGLASFGGIAESWHADMNALLGRLPSFAALSPGEKSQALGGVQWMAQVLADTIAHNGNLPALHAQLAAGLDGGLWGARFSVPDRMQLKNGLALVMANANANRPSSGAGLGGLFSSIPSPAQLGSSIAAGVANNAARAASLLHDAAHTALGVAAGAPAALAQVAQLQHLAGAGVDAAKTVLHAVSQASTLPADVLHGIVHNPISQLAIQGIEKSASVLHTAAPWAAMAVSFVPGVGTGAAATIAAADALARGAPITDAFIAAGRAAIPGGIAAQMAFDAGVRIAKGQGIDHALIDATLGRLPPRAAPRCKRASRSRTRRTCRSRRPRRSATWPGLGCPRASKTTSGARSRASSGRRRPA